jgi:putative endonuclease
MAKHNEAGKKAEQAAETFLQQKGCRIVDKNWRTRRCEIDVVAVRGTVVYFCEVKYRSHARQGRGLDYVTQKKLQQMIFAAQSWVHAHGWQGDYELCAIEISGADFRITNVVKGLT